MANDVSIVVSAELGDTLIKLDLAKRAIKDIGDESEETAAKQDAASASTFAFKDALASLSGTLQGLPVIGPFIGFLTALPVLLPLAAFGVVALTDALGTLIAIVADLVAPLTVVIGLLGLLGAGFAIAAKKAFGMHEDGFGQAISGLKKQFEDLTTTLVGRFMPVFQFLIHSASQALDFLNRIAKLPLDQAFQQLAQKGIPAVKKFLDQVGHMIAHPIRLAIQLAFGGGRGSNEAASAVSQIWNEITNFLLGYTKSHPIELRPGVFKIKTTTVDGALQPFLDWFNRHDFTKSGTKIGHEILNGLKPLAGPIGQFIISVFENAFKTVVNAAIHEWDHLTSELTADMHRWNSEFESFVLGPFISGWHSIGGAINAAKSIADHFLDILHQIADFFSHVFTLNINWPSPPSWLTSLGGILGGGGSSSTAGRTGQGGNSPGGHVAMHFHLHAASNDQASFRRFAREVGREIGRQNHILAGGQ